MGILMSQDITRSTLAKKEFHELAEELLNRFPRVDRATLLKDLTARYFLDMKYGCKREERAACDYLNLLQRLAVRLATMPMLPEQAHRVFDQKLEEYWKEQTKTKPPSGEPS